MGYIINTQEVSSIPRRSLEQAQDDNFPPAPVVPYIRVAYTWSLFLEPPLIFVNC